VVVVVVVLDVVEEPARDVEVLVLAIVVEVVVVEVVRTVVVVVVRLGAAVVVGAGTSLWTA
jgi:hypothetical protein